MEETYKKSKGNAGQKGVQFQLDLVTVCLLNALRNHKNWKISSENPIAGKYDDIVVELAGEAAVLIQAKHKENRKITKDQLLSDNSKNSDFSLPKYFFSYEEVKSKFPVTTVIICTNTAINTKGLKDILTIQPDQPDSLLYHERDCSFYSFNENILPDLSKSAEAYLDNNSRDKGVGKSVITDENLKDFLRNLRFFSCYPCEDYLHQVIEESLSRLSRSGFYIRSISSQEIRRKIEDWFQQPKGEYLTEARAKAMLCEIRSDKYCESLKDFNVSFGSNDLDIIGPERIIHVKAKEKHLLQMMKIYSALQGDKTRKLYVNPDDAVEVQKHVVEAFNLRRYKFLIIAWAAIEDETAKRGIINTVRRILEKEKYKKVILVAGTDAELVQQFGLADIRQLDGSVTFQDLSKDSREMLLRRRNFTFQGEWVTLGELLHTETAQDYTESLDSAMLEELVRGREIKVGVRPLDLDEDTARYYVSRRFATNVYEMQWETYTLTEENVYHVKEKTIVISETAGMGKSTILTKTAVTIKKTYLNLWVIKINLYDYSRVLKDFLKMKRNQISAVELLNSLDATKMTNEFEKLIFSMSERVVLMLDGVDEISPDYTDLVLSLLNSCQEAPNFKKIFVTTRPHVDLKLEKARLFQILPFRTFEQIAFLSKYWLHNLHLSHENKEKCEQYATKLLRNISSWTRSSRYWQNTFTEIPLQIRMLAEIFQENINGQESGEWEGCKDYLESGNTDPKLPEMFNIAKLYDTFVEKKRDVFIDKASTGGSVTATLALLKQFESCLDYHCSLAVHTILPEYQQVFKTKSPDDSDTERCSLKIGIVQRLAGRIHFIHRTFTEYFVAHSIVQELKLQNPDPNFQLLLINRILWTDEFKIVRTFLDVILQRVSVPSNKFKQYRKYDRSNANLIFKLVREGHVAILRLILESVDFKVVEGRSVSVGDLRLRLSLRRGNFLNDLAFLVRQAGINIKRENGDTLLHLAAEEGHLEMVDFLVQQGANVNLRNGKGDQVLHAAASRGASDIVAYLVEHGADVNVRDQDSFTALHLAVKYNKIDIVEYLLERGADINMKNSKNKTALNMAIFNEYWSIVKYLLETEADVNAGDDRGLTALHMGVKFRKMPIVEYILKQGVDVNKRNGKDNTALHIATYDKNLSTVKYLVQHGANVNAKGDNGFTALHVAALFNEMEIVDYLLENGADIDVENSKYNTPLHMATYHENWNIVEYLVQHGADINAGYGTSLMALHVAVKFHEMEMVKYILTHKVDVNKQNSKNNTALHIATYDKNLEMVKYLVEHGADVNVGGYEDRTALHIAVLLNKIDIVEYLLQHGVHVNMTDSNNRTVLYWAIDRNHLEIVECLVKHGAKT